MAESNVWIAFGALVLTFIGYAVTATVYVTRIELACNQSVATAKELVATIIEREVAKEQKARHDMASHIQTQVASLDSDYRDLSNKMSSMVHKEDLHATEARIAASIDKLEVRLEAMFKDKRNL